MLPLPVLEEAQADLLNWKGSGISVMEMSHRGKEFMRIIEEAEADLRALLSIPDNYKVLFLQGGATQQFAALPLNLSQPGDTVDYVSCLEAFTLSTNMTILCWALVLCMSVVCSDSCSKDEKISDFVLGVLGFSSYQCLLSFTSHEFAVEHCW